MSEKDKKDKNKDEGSDFKKIIIGIFIGSAIVGGGFSLTDKGKKFWKKTWSNMGELKDFLASGYQEMFKEIKDLLSNFKDDK